MVNDTYFNDMPELPQRKKNKYRNMLIFIDYIACLILLTPWILFIYKSFFHDDIIKHFEMFGIACLVSILYIPFLCFMKTTSFLFI